MEPRFRPTGGASEHIGVAGHKADNNRDGVRHRQPTTDQGTVVAGTRFSDLETGEEWYYDGDAWRAMRTVESLILDELKETRRLMLADSARMIGLLEEMRDALLKIA